MMKVGFTGTRNGCTIEQLEALRELFNLYEIEEGHHGDCIGADNDFHTIAREYGARIVIHPPNNKTYRAYCQGDESWSERPYLVRNKDVVREGEDLLLACPDGFAERQRSGTWSTVRFARSIKRRYMIIYPDGGIENG